MAYFFIFFLTALGWSALPRHLLSLPDMPGLNMMLGLAVSCFLLYFIHDWLGFHVSTACVCVAAGAACGVALGGWRILKTEAGVFHPMIVLPVVCGILWLIFGPRRYFPYQWDEFSNWWLMPKQIWIFDALRDAGFPYKNFLKYTPGWPLLVAYPTFLTGSEFEDHYLIWAPFVMGVAAAALVFDVLWVWCKQIERSRALLLIWLVLLLLARIKAGVLIYPSSLLIEFAQAPVMMAILIGLLQMRLDSVRLMRWAGATGLLIAFAFWLKKPCIVILFMVPFAIPWRECGRKRALGLAALLVVPALLSLALWEFKTRHLLTMVQPPANVPLSRAEGAQFFQTLLTYMLTQALLYLPFTVLTLYGFWTMRKDSRLRALATGLILWMAVYLILLVWIYFNTFSAAERLSLSGIDRYLGLVSQIIFVLTVLVLIHRLLPQLRQSWVLMHGRSVAIALGLMVLILLEQVQANYHNHNNGQPNVFHLEGARLKHLIQDKGLQHPHVVMIAQGYWRDRWREAMSQSLEHPAQVRFNLDEDSWIATREDHTDENAGANFRTDSRGFKDLIWRADVVWPVKLDAWAREQLTALADPATCSGDLQRYFLLRQADSRRLVCTLK